MDFFTAQERAKKQSKRLLFYFLLAVAGTCLALYAVVMGALYWGGEANGKAREHLRRGPDWSEQWGHFDPQEKRQASIQKQSWQKYWNGEVFLWTAGGTLLVILLGSLYKSTQLRSGGESIARALGGRPVDRQTTDLEEKRLLNVVEEMAIASGVPTPEVYLLDHEEGINAFAAGHNPSDAVIGVTRGCIQCLNREELQGVMAHEFSHILNGDMRINLRLIGLLFGILMVSLLGRVFFRIGLYSGGSYRSSREKNGSAVPFILLGLVVIIIGSIGSFFAKLIQSALSRQREYLADASAVQFTRNPGGIGGALKKIGGAVAGSKFQAANASEVSHLFFANGLGKSFSAMFATHPPLEKRISAIDSRWDGGFTFVDTVGISAEREHQQMMLEMDRKHAQKNRGAKRSEALSTVGLVAGMQDAIAHIGNPSEAQLLKAGELRHSFSKKMEEAIHTRLGAQIIIFALLLTQDDALQAEELAFLKKRFGNDVGGILMSFQKEFLALHSAEKLAIVDLSIPTLRHLNPREYENFLEVMQALITSDKKINLFEFTLQKIISRHLDLYFGRKKEPKEQYKSIRKLHSEATLLLSTLAHLGHGKKEQIEHAFEAGIKEIEQKTQKKLNLLPSNKCDFNAVDKALNAFDQSSPLVKKDLLYACAKTVMADKKLTNDEAELLRAIADTIGCPIPPFVHEAKTEGN